uniref:Thioredoxin domain-containing protein n=1 Tax=Corethron hystrix TaxID=216773 RepID=A0A7S1B2Q3_9STRA
MTDDHMDNRMVLPNIPSRGRSTKRHHRLHPRLLPPTLLSWPSILLLLLLASPPAYGADSSYQYPKVGGASPPAKFKGPEKLPARVDSVDYWDTRTLLAATGIRASDPAAAAPAMRHDAAIFFYTPRDPNSLTLGPAYANIAGALEAGTAGSGLVAVMFDCETDNASLDACRALKITHYPTFMYLAGDRAVVFRDHDPVTAAIVGSPEKAAGPAGRSPLPYMVKFQGNWMYLEEIRDWIKVMRSVGRMDRFWRGNALVNYWRSGGPIGAMLNLALGGKNGAGQKKMLPVGLPSLGTNGGGGTSQVGAGGAAAPLSEDADKLKTEVAKTKKLADQYKTMATQQSLLLDLVLFPKENSTESAADADVGADAGDKNETQNMDVFSILHSTDGWIKDDGDVNALRICARDLTVDYCTRAVTYLDTVIPMTVTDFVSELKIRLKTVEPFCLLIDGCVNDAFAKEECRPARCPLVQDVGCRYINACLEKAIVGEFRKALVAKGGKGASAVGAAGTAAGGSGTTAGGAGAATGEATTPPKGAVDGGGKKKAFFA